MTKQTNETVQSKASRDRIDTDRLIKRLDEHQEGTLELTLTQVQAINILLRKSLPDLRPREAAGEKVKTHED